MTPMKPSPLPILVLCAACEGGLSSDAQPIVSVLKLDGNCFALMTPDTPIAPVLGIAATCSYALEPRLFAGVDSVQVVVDYGPDVTFAGTTTAPPPSVTVTVDGVVSETPIEITDELRVGGRAYFIATFHAPPELSKDVRIAAGVNAGFQAIVPTVFETIAPPVAMSLVECPPGPPCELAGSVGSVHAQIAIVGQVPQQVAIHSSIDGVPQPDPVPPVTTQVALGRTEATVAIPVPNAPDESIWELRAQLGESPPVLVTAVVRAPAIASELSCAPSCNLGTGDPVGLEITAPSEIRPLQALVTTRLDGVPQLVAAPVALVPIAGDTAQGLLGLDAPPSPGTWQIDVTVAGYSAPAIVTTVQ
jgi:hypothetical protein